MLPHKTKRGQAALERLKVFDGIPPPYDKVMKDSLFGLEFLSFAGFIWGNKYLPFASS